MWVILSKSALPASRGEILRIQICSFLFFDGRDAEVRQKSNKFTLIHFRLGITVPLRQVTDFSPGESCLNKVAEGSF